MRDKLRAKPRKTITGAVPKKGKHFRPEFSELSIDRRIEIYNNMLNKLLSEPKLAFDRSLLDLLPRIGGYYHIAEKTKGAQWRSLYAGMADDLRDVIVKRYLMGDRTVNPIKIGLTAEYPLCKNEGVLMEYFHSRCYVQYLTYLIDISRHFGIDKPFFEQFMISVLCPAFNSVRYPLADY